MISIWFLYIGTIFKKKEKENDDDDFDENMSDSEKYKYFGNEILDNINEMSKLNVIDKDLSNEIRRQIDIYFPEKKKEITIN